MSGAQLIYLGGRALMCALCFGGIALALRMLLRRSEESLTPAIVPVALITLLAGGILLSGYDAYDTIWVETRPINLADWSWFLFDIGVPLLAIGVLHAIGQRDAALDRLNELASTDALTGLANRRAFGGRAEIAIRISRQRKLPAAVLAFDIDRFKTINDSFGHAAGDVVLRGVAAALSGGMRQGDVLGRIGGEEFAALLPASDIAGAMNLAERLRQRLTERVPHPAGTGTPLTISIGVAEVPDNMPPADALTHALAAADDALYAAKRNGRDRVECAGTSLAAAA